MEAPVLSVLNANYLCPENIKPEVISINDEDLKSFKYLQNYQRHAKKMYVPIQGGNLFDQFKSMETINIPKQIIKYIYDNPQNALLQSILEVEFTSQISDTLEQSTSDILSNYLQQNSNKLINKPDNMRLEYNNSAKQESTINTKVVDKLDNIRLLRLDKSGGKHCTCCEYFKNHHHVEGLVKYNSEPNIKLLFSKNSVCCDNNYDCDKQVLFTKMDDSMSDNYTEVDGKSLKRLRNNDVSVKQLSCDINDLMYRNAVMSDDLKKMKRGYQVRQ